MRINQSRLVTYLDCGQLYRYIYEDNLVPRHTPPPLLTGSAVHAGLAVLRQTEDLKLAQAALDDFYAEALKREGEIQAFLPEELEAAKGQVLWGKMILARFVRQFPEPEWQVLEPEVKGEVVLGNSDHTLVFRVDGILQWRGQLWIGEYKTKNRVTAPYIKSFNMDKQVTCYVYGTQKKLGKPIAGAVVFIFPKEPIDAPIRVEYPLRTPEQLTRFEGEAVDICEMIEARRASGAWIRNERMCLAPGRKECTFYNLCAYGDTPDARSKFAVRTPDYVDSVEA